MWKLEIFQFADLLEIFETPTGSDFRSLPCLVYALNAKGITLRALGVLWPVVIRALVDTVSVHPFGTQDFRKVIRQYGCTKPK